MDAILDTIMNLFSDFDIGAIEELLGGIDIDSITGLFEGFDIGAIGDLFSGILG